MESSKVPVMSPATLKEHPADPTNMAASVMAAGETEPISGPVIAKPQAPIRSTVTPPPFGELHPPVVRPSQVMAFVPNGLLLHGP